MALIKDLEEWEKKRVGTIPCIGVDGKDHVCLPNEDTAICGMKIKTKKPWPLKDGYRYGCYECSF